MSSLPRIRRTKKTAPATDASVPDPTDPMNWPDWVDSWYWEPGESPAGLSDHITAASRSRTRPTPNGSPASSARRPSRRRASWPIISPSPGHGGVPRLERKPRQWHAPPVHGPSVRVRRVPQPPVGDDELAQLAAHGCIEAIARPARHESGGFPSPSTPKTETPTMTQLERLQAPRRAGREPADRGPGHVAGGSGPRPGAGLRRRRLPRRPASCSRGPRTTTC